MSEKRVTLVREMAELVDSAEHLRAVLVHFSTTIADVAALLEGGDLPIAALKGAPGPMRRQELTEALEEFERMRHQVRVSFFALATEQGTSISEVGRMLGISRQLASRVAAEAGDAGPTP